METIYIVLVLCVIVVVPLLSKVLKKQRAGSEKYQQMIADFQQQVNGMLETDEIVEGLCGYKPCAAVTNRRLLVSTKEGVDTVQFADIKSLKGLDNGGNKTTNPQRMLVFEIKANKKYTLGNHSEGFDQVVNSLYQYTGK